MADEEPFFAKLNLHYADFEKVADARSGHSQFFGQTLWLPNYIEQGYDTFLTKGLSGFHLDLAPVSRTPG